MTFPESEGCCSEDRPPSKRLKLDDVKACSSSDNKEGLLNFCDDIILEILYNLKPVDLLALSQCCQKLHRLVCDWTLWEYVDLSDMLLADTETRRFVQFFQPSTKSLVTKGTWKNPPLAEWDPQTLFPVPPEGGVVTSTISAKLLEDIAKKAPNLSSFTFENHVFDCEDINYHMVWYKFPAQLEDLAFRTCHLIKRDRHNPFFSGIYQCLPNLKKLDLSGNMWFEPHSFLALSKCKHLKELRLADCLLSDFVPYVSLSTRFGFQALTVLDLRRTWVSDREVSCFDKTATLRELYLESPNGTRGKYLITDLAVTSFGGSVDEWNNMGYIVMFMDHFEGFVPSALSVIELTNYVYVSDTSLRHCASCLKGLKRLNVKGTSCSLKGIANFMRERPDVDITSDYSAEVEAHYDALV